MNPFVAPFHRVLDALNLPMAPTATYARRSCLFVPVDPSHPSWDGRCGTLTIKLQHSRAKTAAKVELDTYAVEEQAPAPGFPGRTFLLLNLTDPKQEDVYEVCLGPVNRCKCKAGKCRVASGCKHASALEEVIAFGELAEPLIPGWRPQPDDDAGEPRYEDEPGCPTTYELEAAHA